MFSETLKALRTAHKISQPDLARSLGVTKQCISNWENDNIQPSVEMLVKIARYFSVSTDYLLGLETKKTIDASGISDESIAHLKWLVEMLKRTGK